MPRRIAEVVMRMKLNSKRSFRPISKGTSLIEVMVSVFILSVGLLGIAAMQATSLRNIQSGMQRTQVVIQSYAVMDAMRANAASARASAYNVGWTCAALTGTTLADNDISAWITSMQTTVSDDACGRIACVGSVCTIDVRWNDSRGSGGSTAQQISTVTRI